MSDAEYDEDFKWAVALSLQEQVPVAGNRANVINLVSDDDDEVDDLDVPLTLRKSRGSQITPKLRSDTIQPNAVESDLQRNDNQRARSASSGTKDIGVTQPMRGGMLGLDRKTMEEERLKRQRQREESGQLKPGSKRHASIFLPSTSDREMDVANTQASRASAQTTSKKDEKRQKTGHINTNVISRNEEELLNKPGIQYPDGTVKKTWVKGVPRVGDDIKIEEVLQKDGLRLAILSAFQVEPEWVQSKLDPSTKVVWVLQAKTAAEILSFSTHIRVVIPSANLTSYDWGETGVMENVCFLIDLPRLPVGGREVKPTYFAEELFYFLDAMGLDQGTIGSLRNFDFSRTSQLAFVHSIGGSHLDRNTWKRTGYCGLGTAIQCLGLRTDAALDIDFLTASLGSLNENFLMSLYNAAQGDDGLVEYGWRAEKISTRIKEMSETKRKVSGTLNDRFRIYFPTAETVANSRGGIGCGGTICLQAKWYDAATFPRHLMRDCQSLRPGILMHSKMIFVRGNGDGQNSNIAWAYVGSANCSESAWGRLVKNKDTGEPKLTLRNWECGVVLPMTIRAHNGQALNREDKNSPSLGIDVFAGNIPVPMQVPGTRYGLRRPWFFKDR